MSQVLFSAILPATISQKLLIDARLRLYMAGMPESKPRYLFIDLLRFVAAFFMIQGHVFDAVLSSQIKALPLYRYHDFFHGFVAPAFLFASGVAFGALTMRQWDEHTAWGKRPRKRLRRYLGLIAIGYALHLPYFSLRKTISAATPETMKSFLQSDVLQCVGVTLLLLQVGVLLIRDRRLFAWTTAAAAAVIIFASPLTWSTRFSDYLPVLVASYLSPENGSWFPLFPWSAYLLCGAVAGFFVSKAKTAEESLPLMLKGGAVSLGVFLLSWAAMYLPFDLYPAHDFWKSNPTIFLVRVSAVSIVATGIFFVGFWLKIAPRIPLILGRESLFIYILHLVLVYGSVVNRGLAQRYGPTLSVSQALAAFVLVLAVVTPIAVLWRNLKADHETVAAGVTAAGAAVFLVVFAMRPW